jgi:hypothetical protein
MYRGLAPHQFTPVPGVHTNMKADATRHFNFINLLSTKYKMA